MKSLKQKSFLSYESKQGYDERPEIKALLDEVIAEAFELVSDERSDAYPYDLESAKENLEYKSRDGFIPFSHNHGGVRIHVFDTVPHIVGSGTYPASVQAHNQVTQMYEYNRTLALEELGFADRKELSDDESEKVYEKTDELGADDTIMFEVSVMYGGEESGVHTAWVQVGVNWECPYHRSSGAFSRNTGHRMETEEFVEVEVRWKKAESGKRKMLKAIKAAVTKLF